MKRVTFRHEASGLERTLSMRDNGALQNGGHRLSYFQSEFPRHSWEFGDKFDEVSQTLEVKVRCCRKHHRIILWPNGRLTLAAHQGKKARQTMQVARALGQTYRCVEILKAWRIVMDGPSWQSDEARKILPAELKKAADLAKAVRQNRRSTRYRMAPSHPPSTNDRYNRRLRHHKKIMSSKGEEVFGRSDWRSSGIGKVFKKNAQTGRHTFIFAHEQDEWWRNGIVSGILSSKLRLGDRKFFPIFIPNHVIAKGSGWIPAINCRYKQVWIEIQKTDERIHRNKERYYWKVVTYDETYIVDPEYAATVF